MYLPLVLFEVHCLHGSATRLIDMVDGEGVFLVLGGHVADVVSVIEDCIPLCGNLAVLDAPKTAML